MAAIVESVKESILKICSSCAAFWHFFCGWLPELIKCAKNKQHLTPVTARGHHLHHFSSQYDMSFLSASRTTSNFPVVHDPPKKKVARLDDIVSSCGMWCVVLYVCLICFFSLVFLLLFQFVSLLATVFLKVVVSCLYSPLNPSANAKWPLDNKHAPISSISLRAIDPIPPHMCFSHMMKQFSLLFQPSHNAMCTETLTASYMLRAV